MSQKQAVPSVVNTPGTPLGNWLRELFNSPPGAATEAVPFETLLALGLLAEEHGGSGSRPRLLIVLTTFNRVGSASRVLAALHDGFKLWSPSWQQEVAVLVIEDPSAADYAPLRQQCATQFGYALLWLRAQHHLGKQGFWRSYQTALQVAARVNPEHALFLQDDLEFDTEVLMRALQLFAALQAQAHKGANGPQVLSLIASSEDERFGRWVWYPRRQVPGLPVRRTQWFDLPAFLINAAALEALRYRMVPIHPARWRHNPTLSSGVGRQLTRRLCTRAKIYQCFPPLVFHGSDGSQMNPEARAERALDNRELRER